MKLTFSKDVHSIWLQKFGRRNFADRFSYVFVKFCTKWSFWFPTKQLFPLFFYFFFFKFLSFFSPLHFVSLKILLFCSLFSPTFLSSDHSHCCSSFSSLVCSFFLFYYLLFVFLPKMWFQCLFCFCRQNPHYWRWHCKFHKCCYNIQGKSVGWGYFKIMEHKFVQLHL